MKEVLVYHYDAFSRMPGKGNPAGIVLEGDSLTEKQMQEVAQKVGFNETAFVVKSNRADLGIRYFTPGHEMNLCGHGTMGTLYCMLERGRRESKGILTIETKAGILQVKISEAKGRYVIRMGQAVPEFKEFEGSIDDLASVIGIASGDIDTSLPVIYGSTGTWTFLVPIRKLSVFSKMNPDNKKFPEILTKLPHSSIHPFCLETIHKNSHMHSRHFSSPFSGTIEDPVTGTASGVMGAYYSRYIKPGESDLELIMEQGQEIDRDGQVFVHVSRQGEEVSVEISGTAVYVGEKRIEI